MFVLSLFPGIGLLDHAFELEGFCIVRGPDCLWGGDVRRFHPPEGKFDGIIGGPPCQCFSTLVHLVRAHGREPRFGNLIPEFERCVREALPTWFLMENVAAAPEPCVTGYAVRSFTLCNSMLDRGDGHGQEQRRVRRFTFGLNADREPPSLLSWIDLATFTLPDADGTVTQWSPNNSKAAKTRKRTVTGSVGGFTDGSKKPAVRAGAVTGAHGYRKQAVTGGDGGPSVRMARYKLPDALRLQGLPENFLDDAPFTAEGKLKAVANGVPIPMGRALAKAVREALANGH